ncbi:MAG TPA: nuclear transport factor 2 family protein [Pseudonocardiaceae bacterium]|jgi:ketosteroid isomerase-like protein|nr:nuclear transport factor 2 family protein [Pseudonocardiaceae bacterium]
MTNTVNDAFDMSSAFDTRLNDGDLEGLLALLAPGAISRTPQGEVLEDPQAIRANLAGLITAGARLHNRPRLVLTSGDVALLLIDWTLELANVGGTPTMTGTTTNVVTRTGADDGWRLAILNPIGTAGEGA